MSQRLLPLAGSLLVVFAACGSWTPTARAQALEIVGTRAQGLSGAFVAVADDSTAVYWNPAGLATGPFFSLVVDRATLDLGSQSGSAGQDAARDGSTIIAVATLPVGVSYYRLEAFRASPASTPGGPRTLRALVTDNVGLTLVQSVVSSLAVGTTVRYVRGGAGHEAGFVGTDALDRAEEIGRHGSSAFDMDVGAVATFGSARLGIVARNLVAPSFEAPDGTSIAMSRQVRAGAAWIPTDRLTVALDGDLTRTTAEGGDRRNVAAGAETWWGNRRVGVRGGVRVSTVGDARPAGSVGGSVGVFRGLWVDGQGTFGGDESDSGWSLAARVAF